MGFLKILNLINRAAHITITTPLVAFYALLVIAGYVIYRKTENHIICYNYTLLLPSLLVAIIFFYFLLYVISEIYMKISNGNMERKNENGHKALYITVPFAIIVSIGIVMVMNILLSYDMQYKTTINIFPNMEKIQIINSRKPRTVIATVVGYDAWYDVPYYPYKRYIVIPREERNRIRTGEVYINMQKGMFGLYMGRSDTRIYRNNNGYMRESKE